MSFASRFITAIDDIPAQQWNAIAGIDYPFLRHEFLSALETSGSVHRNRGWQPLHLLVYENDALCAAMPLYIKSHSYGEYVFDWSWAEAYHQHGLDYYPKLLSAIPFTPAQGARLAHQQKNPGALFQYVTETLSNICQSQGFSGWHVLFSQAEENLHFQSTTALARVGCQFHWFNQDYADFEGFLASCTSRKRKTLRKERQKVIAEGVSFQRLTADAITAASIDVFYAFYQSTYLRLSGHGGYLSKSFFHSLLATPLKAQMLLVMAYKNGEPIAAALNFFSSTTLYGRYWGAKADMDSLHFETCYYQGIDFCIEKKLHCFDSGAQGEHKIQRGFSPVCTFSWHWLAEKAFFQAVEQALLEETISVQNYAQEAQKRLPYHFLHQNES